MPQVGSGRTKKAKNGRKTGHQLSGSKIPADVMAYRRGRIAQLIAKNTPKGQPMTDTDERRDIHTAFGLSYSNYLVMPRTLLQSMPEQWQHDFVTLIDQFNDAFAHVEQAECYIVTAANECTYSDLTDEDMKALGITCDRPEDDYETYWDKDGTEHESGDSITLPRPGGDPVPHYNRGRTHIEPKQG